MILLTLDRFAVWGKFMIGHTMPPRLARSRRFAAAGVGVVLLAAVAALGQSASLDASGTEAVVRPSFDGLLSFAVTGTISKIPVEPGQTVKAGSLLVQLDDGVEQARLLQFKAEAENTTPIEAADAQLAQYKVVQRRVAEAHKKDAATDLELEEADLQVKIAELRVTLARFDQDQAARQYAEAQRQIERMRIVAPCDGVIEAKLAEPGESVEPAKEVIRLVQIDPLWVEVPMPLDRAVSVRVGDTARVKLNLAGAPVAEGTVIYVAAVVDAASETRLVRVSLPNPKRYPAGTRARVTLAPTKPAPAENP